MAPPEPDKEPAADTEPDTPDPDTADLPDEVPDGDVEE